jgi:hypothetical protein
MITLFIKEKKNEKNNTTIDLSDKFSEEENWDNFHVAIMETLDLYNVEDAEWLVHNCPEINTKFLLREFIKCIVNYGDLFIDVYLLVNHEFAYGKSIVRAVWKFVEDYIGTYDSMEEIENSEYLENIQKIVIERDNEFHVFKK